MRMPSLTQVNWGWTAEYAIYYYFIHHNLTADRPLVEKSITFLADSWSQNKYSATVSFKFEFSLNFFS